MSGGAWEYVMGVMLDENDQIIADYDFLNKKYYDIYNFSINQNDFSRRILGDAVGEIGPFDLVQFLSQNRSISSWYSDESYFIWTNFPFILRGAAYTSGLGAGLFGVGNSYGTMDMWVSFRLILTP